MRLIVRRGVMLASIGVATGLVVAMMLTGAIKSLLFGIRPTDPMVFFTGIVLTLAAASAASYIPARRVLRQGPASSLRDV